ncbi:MAG: hypothetical protein HGB21_01565 [Nitrospirae bacterium]|nr:hypothetical protein [Nitrospirota bacterium]NTW64990.1 hypothetical protein [Nitrospirota bacterium]
MRGNESGVSKLKVLIVLALLGAVIHVGIKYLSVRLDFERMKDTMDIKASAAQVLKDEEILADLAAKAKELDLPLTGENFLIIRDDDKRKLIIKTAWDVEVHYFGGLCGDLCVREYHFAPVAEASLSTR